jgi:ferredoxin/flavodoxin---NADP+ reductase
MTPLGSVERPLRVAIVGSGPSGFYAAEALLKDNRHILVDMYERLPTPFGLVRGGVAPDHQKIKTAARVYEKTAEREGFGYLGNVTVGVDISIAELRDFYDAIIFASGAQTDRRMGIPGEDTPGSHTATEFVAWYNGHPDYRDCTFDLTQETAVIIGQGNVAVDVCRILAKSVEELKHTDIARHALEALAESRVKDIYMIGRRGPLQAKFTLLEIKELGNLAICDPIVDPADLDLDLLSQVELDGPYNASGKKTYPVLQEFARRLPPAKPRRCHFWFLYSPISIEGDKRVERIVLEKNQLVGDPGDLRAQGAGQLVELPCGLVFRSVGYRGIPLPDLPFDERRGLIPNDRGRVLDHGQPVPGLYVAGWIKRGPSGVIGTNKPDSIETVERLLEDIPLLTPSAEADSQALHRLLAKRGVRVVNFQDWRKIDAAEIAQGEPSGKPREKFTRVEEMLSILNE